MNKKLLMIIYIVLFAVSVAMIIWGQQQIGYINLCVMLLGVGCLLTLLYLYNRKYR